MLTHYIIPVKACEFNLMIAMYTHSYILYSYSYLCMNSNCNDFKTKQDLVCLIHTLHKVLSGQSMDWAINP